MEANGNIKNGKIKKDESTIVLGTDLSEASLSSVNSLPPAFPPAPGS